MKYAIELGDREATVEVTDHPDGGYVVTIDDGEPKRVAADPVGAAEWRVTKDEASRRVALVVRDDDVAAQIGSEAVFGRIVDPRDQALLALSGGAQGQITTPMPGAVVRVEVAEGDTVEKGQILVVVEAMKMENEFRSEAAGTVTSVPVSPGDQVDSGAVLAVVEAS